MCCNAAAVSTALEGITRPCVDTSSRQPVLLCFCWCGCSHSARLCPSCHGVCGLLAAARPSASRCLLASTDVLLFCVWPHCIIPISHTSSIAPLFLRLSTTSPCLAEFAFSRGRLTPPHTFAKHPVGTPVTVADPRTGTLPQTPAPAAMFLNLSSPLRRE